MKKAVAIAVILVGILALAGGSVFAAGQIARSNAITQDTARNFAYVDAGILPEEASVRRTEFDFENGAFVYEIEFTANGVSYDYSVDSSSGRILKREAEPLSPALTTVPVASEPAQSSLQNTSPAVGECSAALEEGNAIGLDKAREIALAKAGVSAETVTFTQAHLDLDDGKPVYDIEFYTDSRIEYEYEIDAQTGLILQESREDKSAVSAPFLTPEGVGSSDMPAGGEAGSGAAPSGAISVEDAKAIALKKAGLREEDVVFKKAKLEHEDGRLVYDIEFDLYGQKEFEYEIDLYSGSILKEDIEPWDD